MFYGGRNEFEAASFGTVGLSHDQMNPEACGGKRFECRNGELGRAAEDEIERHGEIE